MTTSAIAAFGVALTRNGNTIAEITNIGGLEVNRDMIDVTSHGSSDTYKEYIPGLKDSAEMTIEGNFKAGDTDGQIGLLTDFEAGTLQVFVLTFPTGITAAFTFNAYVSKFKAGDFPVDGKLPFSATLKISGKPTLAITASGNLTDLSGIEENGGSALTFLPTFAAAKKKYNVTINTASTYIKVTPTLAGATIKIYINGTYNQSVASGAQSGTIAVTDAAITEVRLDVIETGKVANSYWLYVYTA